MRIGPRLVERRLAGLRPPALEAGGGLDDGRVAAGVLEGPEQRALEPTAVDDDDVRAGDLTQVGRRRLERVGVCLQGHQGAHLEAVAGDVLGDVGEVADGGHHVEGAAA